MSYLSLKKLNKCGLFAFLFSLLLISGCIFYPTHKVSTFDLGVPKKITSPKIRLYVMPFMNGTESAYQMLYRTGKYEIEKDPYNRWIKTPGMLITSYLRDSLGFNNEAFSQDEDYILYGDVTLFEINLKEKYTKLSVNYRIKHNNIYILENEETFKQTFDEPSPDNFAKAMSISAGDLANKIRQQLIDLKTKSI